MRKTAGKIVLCELSRLGFSLRVRSVLESRAARLLDGDSSVESLRYENLRVVTMVGMNRKVYIPDFQVGLVNGGCLVIETKGERWTRRPSTQRKARAAITQLAPLGIGYVMLSEKDVYRMEGETIRWANLFAGRDLCRRNLVLGGRMEEIWLEGLRAGSGGMVR